MLPDYPVRPTLTGPFSPIPTACVSGLSAPVKTAIPPAISSTAASGCVPMQPRALAASAASSRRADVSWGAIVAS